MEEYIITLHAYLHGFYKHISEFSFILNLIWMN